MSGNFQRALTRRWEAGLALREPKHPFKTTHSRYREKTAKVCISGRKKNHGWARAKPTDPDFVQRIAEHWRAPCAGVVDGGFY
jgi:hypothetical protein